MPRPPPLSVLFCPFCRSLLLLHHSQSTPATQPPSAEHRSLPPQAAHLESYGGPHGERVSTRLFLLLARLLLGWRPRQWLVPPPAGERRGRRHC